MVLTLVASPILAMDVDSPATMLIPEPDDRAEYVASRDTRALSPADEVLSAKTYTSFEASRYNVTDFSDADIGIVLISPLDTICTPGPAERADTVFLSLVAAVAMTMPMPFSLSDPEI